MAGAGSRRRKPWWKKPKYLVPIGIAAVATAVAIMGDEGVFSPSSKAVAGSATTVTTSTTTSQPPVTPVPVTPATTTSGGGGSLAGGGPAAGTPAWNSAVTMNVNKDYALDGPPITPLDSCTGCVSVADAEGFGIALNRDSGVLQWTGTGTPTYASCLQLLRGGPVGSVSLQTPDYPNGTLAPGSWACAYSKTMEVLAIQYKGTANNITYSFAVNAWYGSQ
jgi:hypothetical protein